MSDANLALSADLPEAVATGDYRLDQEGAPKAYKDAVTDTVRASIAELMPTLSVGHLSTIASDGWPVGIYLRFIASFDDALRPVVHVVLPAGSRELANLSRDARVSFEAHFAAGFERRREAKGVQFQGIASVMAAGEAAAAYDGRFTDAPVGDGMLVRIDVLSVVMFNASGRPQWGQLDYFEPQDP